LNQDTGLLRNLQQTRHATSKNSGTDIQKDESVEYDHVRVIGDLDVNKLNLAAKRFEEAEELIFVSASIKITNSTFNDKVDFSNTVFQNLFFRNTTFSSADFSKATFMGYADFGEATFRRITEFSEALFMGDADFSKATFVGDADFNESTFGGEIKFNNEEDRLKYLKNAYFRSSKLIGFKTNKEWNITDLQTFVTGVSDIYNIFLAQMISKEMEINYGQAFQNIEKYSKENQLLKVYRIKMGSPGGFSFLGLPEIIEQIRKMLIWWYHERSLNELERAEKCLDLVKKYLEMHKLGNKDDCIDDLIQKICKSIKIFKELESSGKLGIIIENLDYIHSRENDIAENKSLLYDIKRVRELNTERVLEPDYKLDELWK
jgi:uncharacterized protein YjbI with pentapeptide repeats